MLHRYDVIRHQDEQQQANEATQRKAARKGESVEKAHVSSPPWNFSHPVKLLSHFLSRLRAVKCDHHRTIPPLCDGKGLFPFVDLYPQTRFCRPVVVGGSFTHLPACCEPQRHVQTEREGNNSQRFRCCPSQPPARYRPPVLSALILSSLPVFSAWLPPVALDTVSIMTSSSAQLWTISFFSHRHSCLCGALFGGSMCLGSGRLQSPFLSKPLCESEPASSSQRQASPVPAGSASPVPAAGVSLHTHIRIEIADNIHSWSKFDLTGNDTESLLKAVVKNLWPADDQPIWV